ncbi:MAG: hypothetical protein IJ574_04635 [Bacilli bacterium]|nr:hypothetical protein [Bacilli bacterium]
MKKILSLIILVLLVVGCSLTNKRPSDAVENYLNNYRNLNEVVLTDLNEILKKENIDEDYQNAYSDTLKRQYRDLSYEIDDEEYNGNNAKVTVKITVYDYYKANKDSEEYLNSHKDEFLDESGNYDASKYMKYRLEKLMDTKDKISYSITFDVKKNNNVWVVEQLDDTSLEKIHGIFNYEFE